MQGPSYSRALRIRTSLAVGIAFVAGATVTFALAYGAARLVGIADLPLDWRIGVAAAGLVTLALLDLRATRSSTYCPLGWRRQTPKSLIRRRSASLVAAAWGFDTGLAVTTVRVAALTWGVLLLAALGLSAWFAGVGYGLGFAIPFIALLWKHRVGRCAYSREPVDPGLGSMLARRAAMQRVSAALLTAGGAVLIALALVS